MSVKSNQEELIVELLPRVQEFLQGSKRLLIDGEWLEASSGRTFTTVNPSNGKILTKVAEADVEDIDRAVCAARKAFSGEWSRISPVKRARLLNKLADLIEVHAEEFSQLESLDAGRTIVSMRTVDLPLAIEHFRYFAGWSTKIEGATIPTQFPDTHVYTRLEPIGVVGAIVPWNFPLVQACFKLAPALTTGCTVVLKPAEQTPLTALLLGQLVLEAGIPPGVVNVCPGYGETAGRALVEHPDVNKIAFTGSGPVGKEIVKLGSKTMKRVSLELGGKSPHIILPDADIETAAKTAASSIFFLSGQLCSAGSRLMVHKDIYQDVVDIVVEEARKLKIGSGLHLDTDMGPLVSEEQVKRVSQYVKLGQQEGGQVVYQGDVSQSEKGGHFIAPTVLSEVSDQLTVVKEEIFGPVLVIQSFETEEELVARANNSEYGLAAGIWTRDVRKAHKLAALLQAGTVWVNCYNYFDAAMPWGGYKSSGYGRDSGYVSLEKYLETKTVCVNLA